MSTLDEPKKDLRVSKTKKAMSTAMFQLLEQNTFDKITINDICRTAMISRTTFYQHFPDKYELVKFSLQQDAQEKQVRFGEDIHVVVEGLLQYIKEHRKIFQNLFVNNVNEELLRILSATSVTNLKERLELRARVPGGVPAEIAAVFLSGGMASLILWWINSDFAVATGDLCKHIVGMFEF